ncbi:MAG TPA: hypothetical protein VFN89_10320 [Solirubrobacterales bacterium]|nr:hypothetical protein [Solirubrobacterales bacterium]
MSSASYGTYAAIFATYAFGNALVATTIGTRVIEAVSTGEADRAELVLRRDLLPVVLCVVAAGATAAGIGSNGSAAAWAAAGMAGFIFAEVGYSYVLGQRRYWLFFGLACARTVLWAGSTLALMLLLPEDERLSGALAASLLGTLVPVIYVAARGGISITTAGGQGEGGAVSGVGIANLALWLLASADRLILAHFALVALATYAALYGLLDRVFRGIANADVQLRLPEAFAARGQASGSEGSGSRGRALWLLLLGAACAAVAPTIVAAASGGRYHPPWAMSVALSAGMVAMLAAVPGFVKLISAGRASEAAKVAVLAAAVNIGGNLALAPRFGTGAAAALTLLGYLIWLIGISLLLRREEAPPAKAEAAAASGSREMADELLEAQL